MAIIFKEIHQLHALSWWLPYHCVSLVLFFLWVYLNQLLLICSPTLLDHMLIHKWWVQEKQDLSMNQCLSYPCKLVFLPKFSLDYPYLAVIHYYYDESGVISVVVSSTNILLIWFIKWMGSTWVNQCV